MNRNHFIQLLTVTLAIVTLIIIGNTQSNISISLENHPELVLYGLLTAFALYFSIQMSNGELSMAHVVGMMAFLAYSSDTSDLILVVIFVGGLSGGFLMILRTLLQSPSQRRTQANLNTLIYVTARVTISYFVAGVVYTQLNAPLPLNDAMSIIDLGDTVLSLISYAMVYIIIYISIFAIQLYAEDHPIGETFRNNFSLILVILVGTVPFAILAAVSPPASQSIVSFAIVVAGTMFSVFGIHAISRVTLRLQKQLDEVQALSRISHAITGNFNLQTLYSELYKHIQQLMQVDHLKVVLFEEDTKHYNYDFIIEQGKPKPSKIVPDDHELVQRVIVTRQPLLISDQVWNQTQDHGLKAPINLCSWLGVPLLSGNTIMGALVVSSFDNKRHFTEVDKNLLTIISGTASIAIENTHLYQQQRVRAEQLTTLNKIAALLSGTLLRDEVFDIIISSASTVTDAHAVAFYMTSNEGKTDLKFIKGAGLSDSFMSQPPQPQLAEKLNNTSIKTTIVENVQQVGHDVALRSHMIAEGKQAWVELPLILNNNNLGVIGIYYNTVQSFTLDQISLMEAYASQATQAVNNAITYADADEALERRIEQLYALAAMGRLLNATMDSQQICDIILSYAGDATQSNRGFISLFDTDKAVIQITAVRNYDKQLITMDTLSQGSNQQVLETNQLFYSNDIRQETGYLPIIPNTRSVLVVPLIRGQKLLGIIRLESDDTHAFTEGDIHFVSQIANQAISAIDNTNLFQKIRNTRDNLQTILDGMEDGILMVNEDKLITIANPPITMLGIDPEAIVNRPIVELLDQDNTQLLTRLGFENTKHLMQVLDHLDNQSYWRQHTIHEYSIMDVDGTRQYVKRVLIPVNHDDDKLISGVMMVFYNKTEEYKLAQARDSLSQMIIHDLRSPLTAVTTSLALLNAINIEDEKIKPIIDKTTHASQQAIQKVLSRINSLLDISKMERGEINIDQEPTELPTIVDNVLISLSPLAHEMNIKLSNQIPDSLPLLWIDSDKIERVLQNLVDNALKYSYEDSEVLIKVARTTTNHIQLDIIDQGPGIPDNYKQSIFNQYTQVEGRNSKRGGVGLGLAFCRIVTEAHGGTIWIEDNPEGGSIFSLTLPIFETNTVQKTG